MALAPEARSQSEGAPDALEGIAGLAGFASVSRVVFPEQVDAPHRLEAVYLFPDRARWRLLALDGRSSERLLVYRFGERAYQLAPGQTRSTEFTQDSLARTLVQLELRRAALFWPDGIDWQGTGDERRATVSPRTADERALGTLVATLKDGRPSRIQARDLLGDEVESLDIDAWQELRGRAWPRTLRLSRHGQPIWTETIETVETQVYFVDLFFQPPDRRGTLPTALAGGRAVLSLDLQGITFRAREIEPGTGWDEALAAARAALDEARSAGVSVDPVPAFELDPGGRPRRLLVRLAERDDTPDEGWTTLGDRPGLALVLEDLAPLDPGLLESLTAAVPPGLRPGVPYCRVLERAEGRQVQVYLPLEGGP